MNALVTGAAGFIGSHLCQALCNQGHQVIALDNLSLGSVSNLNWRQAGSALDFVEGDVTDEALVRKLVAGCDWVFHEAALPSVPLSVEKPLETHAQTLTGALQILIAARDAGVKRFVFASSSAIYGENPVEPKHETLPPQPLSPYALQKYAAERYAQMFHTLYGLETVSLRYFNVFGPRQSFNSPYSGVIARFCTAMLAGKAPAIFGDGHQSRDFVYVENVVNANLLAAKAPADLAAGKVFNVAAGSSVSLLDLVAELNRQTGQCLKPEFHPPRPGDIRRSQADITAICDALGYNPRISWQTGLEATLEFYRSNEQ